MREKQRIFVVAQRQVVAMKAGLKTV